jgi:hypothetical protein
VLSESVPDTCPAVDPVIPESSQVDLEPEDTEMSTLLVDEDHRDGEAKSSTANPDLAEDHDGNDHGGQPSPAVIIDVDGNQS